MLHISFIHYTFQSRCTKPLPPTTALHRPRPLPRQMPKPLPRPLTPVTAPHTLHRYVRRTQCAPSLRVHRRGLCTDIQLASSTDARARQIGDQQTVPRRARSGSCSSIRGLLSDPDAGRPNHLSCIRGTARQRPDTYIASGTRTESFLLLYSPRARLPASHRNRRCLQHARWRQIVRP